MGVDREVSGRVDEILAQAVALLHEGVEVVARWVHGDPAGVIALVGAVDGADKVKLRSGFGTGPGRFTAAMNPELVGAQVGGVQVRLGRVKHHAVDAGIGLVLVVLHVGRQSAGSRVDGEDGAVAGMVVEGVAVDGVGRLLRGEEEDGTGVCVGRLSLGYENVSKDLFYGLVMREEGAYGGAAWGGRLGGRWRWATRRHSWTISSWRRRRLLFCCAKCLNEARDVSPRAYRSSHGYQHDGDTGIGVVVVDLHQTSSTRWAHPEESRCA